MSCVEITYDQLLELYRLVVYGREIGTGRSREEVELSIPHIIREFDSCWADPRNGDEE